MTHTALIRSLITPSLKWTNGLFRMNLCLHNTVTVSVCLLIVCSMLTFYGMKFSTSSLLIRECILRVALLLHRTLLNPVWVLNLCSMLRFYVMELLTRNMLSFNRTGILIVVFLLDKTLLIAQVLCDQFDQCNFQAQSPLVSHVSCWNKSKIYFLSVALHFYFGLLEH